MTDLTPDTVAALKKAMSSYLADYFDKNASDALREKVKSQGKTIDGAFNYIQSVARAFAKSANGVMQCAMPDALVYNLLMHYMEDEAEGATYKTPEQIQAEADREKAEADRKAKEAEKKKAEAVKKEILEQTLFNFL